MTEEIAYFAAGCFWGVEAAYYDISGVVETEVGYMGGNVENPTYKQVCTGITNHAETVRLTFNPSIISYSKLLDIFWNIHDPTTKDRQGPDIGSQYRSLIFYTSQQQRDAAKKSMIERQNIIQSTIVTEILPAGIFYRAEGYHQKHNIHCRRGP